MDLLKNLFLKRSLRDFEGCGAMFGLRNVAPDLDILFEKLTVQIGGCIWKRNSAHYASVVEDFMESMFSFFFSIFSADLYFDTLVIELF